MGPLCYVWTPARHGMWWVWPVGLPLSASPGYVGCLLCMKVLPHIWTGSLPLSIDILVLLMTSAGIFLLSLNHRSPRRRKSLIFFGSRVVAHLTFSMSLVEQFIVK